MSYSQVMEKFDELLDALEKLEPETLSKVKKQDLEVYAQRYLLPLLKRLSKEDSPTIPKSNKLPPDPDFKKEAEAHLALEAAIAKAGKEAKVEEDYE